MRIEDLVWGIECVEDHPDVVYTARSMTNRILLIDIDDYVKTPFRFNNCSVFVHKESAYYKHLRSYALLDDKE